MKLFVKEETEEVYARKCIFLLIFIMLMAAAGVD